MSLAIKLGVPFLLRRGPENPLKGASGVFVATIVIAAVFAFATAVVMATLVVIWCWLFGWYEQGSDATGFIWPSVALTFVIILVTQWLTTSSGMWGIYNDEGVNGGVRTLSFDFTRCMFWSRFG